MKYLFLLPIIFLLGCSEYPYPIYLNMTCYSHLCKIKQEIKIYLEEHNQTYPNKLDKINLDFKKDIYHCPLALRNKLRKTKFIYLKPNQNSKPTDPMVYTPFPLYIDRKTKEKGFYVLRVNGKCEFVKKELLIRELLNLKKRRALSVKK